MKYVAFLRGINVGGHAIIKMNELRRMFESLGLAGVETYIQSGNVIFESGDAIDWLTSQLGHQLEKNMGHRIQPFVRTLRDVQSIARKSPFTAGAGETVHVTFLSGKPDKKSQQVLMSLRSEADDFVVKASEAYNLRRDPEYSIFSNQLMEKTFRMPCTTRNMTVIQKIAEKYE